jgi:hypothetical protein
MIRLVPRRPSPAIVVAFLALLVALSGTSYAVGRLPANSVGAKQLQKRAVTPSKVAPKTIAVLKGEKGDPGPKGDRGRKGDPGLSRILSRQAESIGTGQVTAEVSCYPYEHLVGGGGTSSSGKLAESESDTLNGHTPTKWVVRGIDDPAAPKFSVVAEALCASSVPAAANH